MASIKFLTYNVWSCEHVAVYRRIRAICEIIEHHDPDVIFLQEVTDYIYSLFQEAPWWGNYHEFSSKEKKQNDPWPSNSDPFCLVLSKLPAGKVVLPQYRSSWAVGSPPPPRCPRAGQIPSDLLSAWVYGARHRLRAATCSLAGPTPSDIGSVHRRATASAFLEHFDAVHQPQPNVSGFVLDGNVVLGGDLGWDDDLDGPLRLGDDGWVDAWRELRGGDECGGWTYDAVANPMLRRLGLPVERRRPDRFICKLRDFTLGSIEMVGVEPIPGVTRYDDKGNALPVLPSHHFGLLLTICPKHN
ncbi:unnamed protein product [Urochloa decumbens]|uniref:Endonuclease/exonuclease/phosphatase domain-containing protein n=1 Tax=Urochloa decumbens TaxID=240449 RepID=A0ABC9FYA5_9POAL